MQKQHQAAVVVVVVVDLVVNKPSQTINDDWQQRAQIAPPDISLMNLAKLLVAVVHRHVVAARERQHCVRQQETGNAPLVSPDITKLQIRILVLIAILVSHHAVQEKSRP